MEITNYPTTATKTYPAELRTIIDKAARGDTSVLPQLKTAFDQHPELTALLGDLVEHAEQALINLVAGENLVGQEALTRQVAGLRVKLEGDGVSELEKLLIDRIVISWVEVYYDDIQLAEHLHKPGGTSVATQAVQKRLDRAHNRLLAAVRALVTAQKLLRPALTPLQIATGTTARRTPGLGIRPRASMGIAVGVEN